MPIDETTGTPGGLKKEHAPVPITPGMRWWIKLDEELTGALDANGCFHNPVAVNDILERYGVTDDESMKTAREVLRYLGLGRAEALFEDDDAGA